MPNRIRLTPDLRRLSALGVIIFAVLLYAAVAIAVSVDAIITHRTLAALGVHP